MKWTAKENDVVMCPELQLADLPDKIPANIHIVHKNGELGILSENVAGILPCKNGHEIVIEAKYSKIHPMELMMYINNIFGIAVNKERIQSGESAVSLQTIADAFVAQLLLIQSSTKKFKRRASTTISKSVIGKVNWLKTYQRQIVGRRNEVVTTIRKASYDIPENALIAAAAKKISSFYSAESREADILIPWISLADEFRHTHSQLFSMQLKMNEQSLSGAHAFYYVPIMLSKIILGFNGVDSVTEEDTILFNMPGLYEEYIRTGFQRVGIKYGCSIQKGLVPRNFLFCDGKCEMIPDITIYDGTAIKALMDVKYKMPDSKDYYQIFAYMKYTEIDRAYIISPEIIHDQTITAFDGSKITYIKIESSNSKELEIVAEKIIRGVM